MNKNYTILSYYNFIKIKNIFKYKNILNKSIAFNSKGQVNQWYYEVQEIGFNFRLSDLNCALGLSQLKKIEIFKKKRSDLVLAYHKHLAEINEIVEIVNDFKDKITSWHLFVVRIKFSNLEKSRDFIMKELFKKSIQTQVHYIPIHFHPYYKKKVYEKKFKGTESYYNKILTLPLHPSMEEKDVKYITNSLKEIIYKIIKK